MSIAFCIINFIKKYVQIGLPIKDVFERMDLSINPIYVLVFQMVSQHHSQNFK